MPRPWSVCPATLPAGLSLSQPATFAICFRVLLTLSLDRSFFFFSIAHIAGAPPHLGCLTRNVRATPHSGSFQDRIPRYSVNFAPGSVHLGGLAFGCEIGSHLISQLIDFGLEVGTGARFRYHGIHCTNYLVEDNFVWQMVSRVGLQVREPLLAGDISVVEAKRAPSQLFVANQYLAYSAPNLQRNYRTLTRW